MKRKTLLSILLVSIFSITGMGTYSFLVSKSTNPNVVSTGNFPARYNVELYAASGPVFKETTSGMQNQESENYQGWLTNASKYILKDLYGQELDVKPSVSANNPYNTYNNIDENSNTSRKQTIVSGNFYSWDGMAVDSPIKENGTTMHHIVALENSKRLGDDSPKIKLSDLRLENIEVSINQQDVFIGSATQSQYTVKRPSSSFAASDNDNKLRIRTFNYVDGKFAQTFSDSNKLQCADEADLIIFDVGGEGYYAHPSEKGQGDQQALDEIFNMLNGKIAFEKNQKSNPFEPIFDQITSNENGLAKLDRSECEVTLSKNGTVLTTETNIVHFKTE